jgi:LacI family transcriptional regulator
MAYVTSPKLTTIQVPKEALGQQAVRLLENLISNPSAAALTIEVNTELIIRDSVKQINS